MTTPSNSNKMSLGRPLIDLSMLRPDTDPALRQILENIQAALIGAGWICAAQEASDEPYQLVVYKPADGNFYGGKPEDPLNPDLLLTSAGGTIVVQEEGTPLTARGVINFIGASVTAADDAGNSRTNVTIVGGSSNSFETIDCPSGTDPVASSATDTLTLVASGPLTITGDSGTDTITFEVSAYQTIQEDGSDLALRSKLNFATGLTATDDAGNSRTNVNLALVAGTYIDVSGATINVDLTEVSGYNGASAQILKNSTGTIEWGSEAAAFFAFGTIVTDDGTVVADASPDTVTFTATGDFITVAGDALSDTVTWSVAVSAGEGVSISGNTVSANMRMFRTTSTITAAVYNAGTEELTLGQGDAKRFLDDGFPVYDLDGSTTTIYNMVETAIASGKNVLCVPLEGEWVIVVEDCS